MDAAVAALVCSRLECCFDTGGDCTVLARDDSGEECGFQVWSCLMRQWSEVFAAKLDRWNGSGPAQLVIDGAPLASVKAFLAFLYGGKLPSDAPWPCIARLADTYLARETCLMYFAWIYRCCIVGCRL